VENVSIEEFRKSPWPSLRSFSSQSMANLMPRAAEVSKSL
jgi:hypothetical protein